jgi:DNA-binding NarL/FixJ family response regulator
MDRYRILLADGHPHFRDVLRRIIDEQPDLEIAGEAEECGTLINILRHCPAGPLMVLLDIRLPQAPWAQAICNIRAEHPETKVLILSMDADVEYLEDALSHGAEGYLIKESVDEELLRAIETIKSGGIYIPPVLAGVVSDRPPSNQFGRR